MSDIMTSIPFDELLTWVLEEKKRGAVFGVRYPFAADPAKTQTIFERPLETPIGPAAGPHSQLAQNIIASYYAGCRFFELKTVQKMDGAELSAAVAKPCILAEDECYNCEWSTELYVPQAMDEYIKAWVILHLMAKEFGLGSTDGFQFNISVGYDLEGIKTPKIDTFLNGMKEAKDTDSFKNAISTALSMADAFEHVTKEDILAIPSAICNSATISTLHGCPPSEIESIANYLLKEKGYHTFIKCNPTLLGYEFARKTMDDMGYDYVAFGDFHFKDDLQYEDAVPMLTRLMKLSDELHLEFGVKLTNTFPVDVTANELPSEEMYMSGRSLFALSISLAAKLSREFNGKLRIAYSGGADFFNIDRIVACGIWPVTMATTLLKTGGYQRCKQIAELLNKGAYKAFNGIDVEALSKLAEDAKTDARHVKGAKEVPSRKSKDDVPLLDCFTAPCQKEGCPIHQDIPTYIELAGAGKYEEALRVILNKNPLPFLTGTICAHNCMTKCTRNFYEEPVDIRGVKLLAAEKAFDSVLSDYTPKPKTSAKKVAVVGGGPAGLSAAHFLLKAGFSVDIFEKDEKFGGVPRNVIPRFRISEEAIEKDVEMVRRLGGALHAGKEITSVAALKEEGFDIIILAIGAGEPGLLKLESGECLNAIDFLRAFNDTKGHVALGEDVVVIGGGNTAMDTARAAKRNEGVKNVSLVYRRTKRYMPADEEELILAMEDGVIFRDLLSPVRLENGSLLCKKMLLTNERDASGRKKVEESEETVAIPASAVIAAVGERVSTAFYQAAGIQVTDRGKALVDPETMESSVSGVYVIGDGLGGPATAVEGIRDAALAANAIATRELFADTEDDPETASCYAKKGILAAKEDAAKENERCLKCDVICENCVDVCPNRANIAITVPEMKMPQIIHMDPMCNECGNCKVFCPYASAPYLDKFTYFANEADMQNSKNDGFCFTAKDSAKAKVRLAGNISDCDPYNENDPLFQGLRLLIRSFYENYQYLHICK